MKAPYPGRGLAPDAASAPADAGDVLIRAAEALEVGFQAPRAELAGWGVPVPPAGGQQIRPIVSWAVARQLGTDGAPAFWRASYAVQLAHEASLVHDDVVDGAAERRGRPTEAARAGVGAAVVMGDHLLTAGYRLAAATGSEAYTRLFAEAVERTVAGEVAQARARGKRLPPPSYREIVAGKSGELLGLAAAAPAALLRDTRAEELRALGQSLGVLYQMLDDLLDYCPGAETGKPALRDLAQRHWTWLLDELGEGALELGAEEVLARLHSPGADGESPLRRSVARYHGEARGFLARHAALLPGDVVLPALVRAWQLRVETVVAREEVLRRAAAVPADRAVFARHSRSFRFAARFFPPATARQVAAIYAFCRFTDDLVDEAGSAPADVVGRRLDAWLELARASYDGATTGIGFLDRSVGRMKSAGAPFECAADLIEGVRMDLRMRHYATSEELRRYTHGVAATVGIWLAHLFGVRDPWTLQRAAALGHAMQLTNILRDVGEDLERGRLYVPQSLLIGFGVTRPALVEARAGGALPPTWKELVEHLMHAAEADYDAAMEALPRLPLAFRAAVAVAAHVYRGIHDAIRSNGYDNLTRRAFTTRREKLALAGRALRGLVRWERLVPVPLRGALLLAMIPCAAVTAQEPPKDAGARPLDSVTAVTPSGPQDRSRLLSDPVTAPALPGVREAAAFDPGDPPAPPDAPVPTALERLHEIEGHLRARPGSAELGLDRARALYFVGVSDRSAADRGLEQVAALRAGGGVPAPLLDAYEGAFQTLHAKHAFWPVTKLKKVRAGLGALDAAVAAAPHDAEIRYLRLMGGFYLPSLFGRGDEVRADLHALSGMMVSGEHALPTELERVVAGFVLEHAELPDSLASRVRERVRQLPRIERREAGAPP